MVQIGNLNISTRKIDVQIKNDKTGEILFEKKDFEIPESWSDNAGKIVANKYATKDEYSVIDVILRVADFIVDSGVEQNYFLGEDADKFRDDLIAALVDQRIAFNTPAYLNLNVMGAHPQISACFLGDVQDDLGDILDHTKRAGMIFRSGSGVGLNVSKLRSEGESLSKRGTSSGPLSFVKAWDSSAYSVKSGGATRRAAVLVRMDVDHPDIEKFIEAKEIEERKALALMEHGFSADEAYSTVAYQNANHSVGVTNAFMQAVIEDKGWDLVNRGDKQIVKTVNAKDLLRRIAASAWRCGDPGLQFHDRINRDNPIPNEGEIISSNPCGEIYGIPWTCCMLCAINVLKYNGTVFNWDQLDQDIGLVVKALDILIDAAYYPHENFKEVAHKSRQIGIGMTNLASLLMIKGMPYGSKEALDYAGDLQHFISKSATKHSITLAKQMGPFEWFDANKDATKRVIMNVSKLDNWTDFEAFGIRNSQLTTAQPCGTVGFMLGSESLGIEPIFARKMTKNLIDGGKIDIIPECVNFAGAEYLNGDLDNDNPPDLLKTANELTWKQHIDMVSVLQDNIYSGISKTVNLPKDCSIDDVVDAYIYAWRKGLKGITVYKDESKAMQPLTSKRNKCKGESLSIEDNFEEPMIPLSSRIRLEDERKSITHKFDISGYEGYLTVGLYENGSPGELFVTISKQGSMISGLLDSYATLFSLSLQYGVPLMHIVAKMKNTRFEPAGVTKNENIMIAKSIMDYIGRWLEMKFLVDESDEDDYYYYYEEDKINSLNFPQPQTDDQDGSGDLCMECGCIMIQAGTCAYCPSCGNSNGGCS